MKGLIVGVANDQSLVPGLRLGTEGRGCRFGDCLS